MSIKIEWCGIPENDCFCCDKDGFCASNRQCEYKVLKDENVNTVGGFGFDRVIHDEYPEVEQ